MTKPQRRLWGVTVARILDLLEHVGPMTQAEICKLLGLSRQTVGTTLGRLTKPVVKPERAPKRVHICGYAHDEEGQRRYPRPIYALGNKRNASKPLVTRDNIFKRQVRAALKQQRLVNVFHQGQSL